MSFIRCPECATEIESLRQLYTYFREQIHKKIMKANPGIKTENIPLLMNASNSEDYSYIFDILGVSVDRLCCRTHLISSCNYFTNIIGVGILSTSEN